MAGVFFDEKPANPAPAEKVYEDTPACKRRLAAEAKKQGFDLQKDEHKELVKDIHILLVGKPVSELPALFADAVKERDG